MHCINSLKNLNSNMYITKKFGSPGLAKDPFILLRDSIVLYHEKRWTKKNWLNEIVFINISLSTIKYTNLLPAILILILLWKKCQNISCKILKLI